MANQKPNPTSSPLSDDTDEGRAFLQARIAPFWKVLFLLLLLGSAFGLLGAVKEPGLDLLITRGNEV